MKRLFSALLACAAISTSAWAATGTMIKDDELRNNASSSAASIGRVAKGASVEVLARRGGWTQISHGGATGWVRILSVKTGGDSAGGDAIGGIFQMGTTRRDSSRVVAVAGLRGLNEEELRSARFNANELMRLNQFASSRSEAEQFARSAGLRSLELAYIKPAKPESENRPTNNIWGFDGI